MNTTGQTTLGPSATRYAHIEKLLASAVESGSLPSNIVLTEGRLATLFGTSRTPVRVALHSLMDRGVLKRFDGRGFLVAGGKDDQPNRKKITKAMLGLAEDAQTDLSPVTSQRIESDVENVLVHALPFGQFAISEQIMADHYGVSRTVVRELLTRLQSRGIVNKHKRSHWVVGPLTANEIAQYYAIRAKLEPLALFESAQNFHRRDIQAMWDRLQRNLDELSSLTGEQMEELEKDLHVHLLSKCKNEHLLRMIHESQLALVVNRVFISFIGTKPFAISLREHSIVLEFVMRGAFQMAADALEEHLVLSAKRTRQRLMTLSVFPEPEFPRYLQKQDAQRLAS